VLGDGGVGRHPEGAEGLGEVGAEVGEGEVEGLLLPLFIVNPALCMRIGGRGEVNARRTSKSRTNPASLSSICACSDAPTTRGGVWRVWASSRSGNRARLMTAHQIGTVFDSASGMPVDWSPSGPGS